MTITAKSRDRTVERTAPPPVTIIPPYRERDWRFDWLARDAGADPERCVKCGRIGFYGPRIRPFAKYRACRFCGFWQDVGEEPEYRQPFVHGCITWPVVAGASYLWWIRADVRAYACPFCMAEVPARDFRARNPFLTRRHPWWKVPQSRPYAWYEWYWSKWELGRGRGFL